MKSVLTCLFLFAASFCSAQNSLALGFRYVEDKNLDIFDGTFVLLNVPIVSNPYSYIIESKFTRKIYPSLEILAAAGIVGRRIDYRYLRRAVTGFTYFSGEISLGIRKRWRLSENLQLLNDYEAGINGVLTSDVSTIVGGTEGLKWERWDFQFVRNKRATYFVQVSLGLETRINDRSSINFFIAYLYQFTPMFQYRAYNEWFDLYHTPIRTHNLNFGVALAVHWSSVLDKLRKN